MRLTLHLSTELNSTPMRAFVKLGRCCNPAESVPSIAAKDHASEVAIGLASTTTMIDRHMQSATL
jgi:hypothetical protein